MPAIFRKSFTACEALAALPPTPRTNSRPPRARVSASKSATASMAFGSRRPMTSTASPRYFWTKLISRSRSPCPLPGGERDPRVRREVTARLLESFEGSDLVEALPDLPGGQLAPLEERLVEPGQVVGLVGRNAVEGAAVEDAEAIVQVTHARGPV